MNAILKLTAVALSAVGIAGGVAVAQTSNSTNSTSTNSTTTPSTDNSGAMSNSSTSNSNSNTNSNAGSSYNNGSSTYNSSNSILTPTYLYLQPHIRENHLVPFLIYVGVVNAYSVGQMIVAHLLKTPFPRSNVLILPLAVAVVDSLGAYLRLWGPVLGYSTYQVAFVFTALGIAVGVYGSFVVSPPPMLILEKIC